jgi:type I restriction enzyme R subunit
VVKQKRFSERLQAPVAKSANRLIEAAQVIEELIAMAKQLRDEAENVEAMGLPAAEVGFYDPWRTTSQHTSRWAMKC